MEKRLVPWIKGIAAAVAAMLIYAVPLGLMTALVLLVAAMEEGSNVLSAQTVPLSKAVILLSEGVGFQGGSIVMGVTPLLLTILLIALIRTVCTKTSTDPRAFVSGAVVWLLLQHVLMSGLHVRLEDSTGVVMGKALLIYTLGYLLAAVPHMPLLGVTKNTGTPFHPCRRAHGADSACRCGACRSGDRHRVDNARPPSDVRLVRCAPYADRFARAHVRHRSGMASQCLPVGHLMAVRRRILHR